MLIRKGGGLGSIFPISSKAKKQTGGGSGNRTCLRITSGMQSMQFHNSHHADLHKKALVVMSCPQSMPGDVVFRHRPATRPRWSVQRAGVRRLLAVAPTYALTAAVTRPPGISSAALRRGARARTHRCPLRAKAREPRMRAAARGASGVCGRRGSGQGRAAVITVTAASFPLPEATLWVRLSVRPLGMPLTAAASGLRGLSLPGLPLLAARERGGTGGALPGCGQKLLKLERLQKGKEEETEGRLAGSCLLLQARESLPLQVWKDPSLWSTAAKRLEFHKRKVGEKEKEASELARSPGRSKSKSCEAALRAWLSIPPLGILLTAAASGLHGLSLPGLPLHAAQRGSKKGQAEHLLAVDRSCCS
ncbi:uncharacterized protein ACIBXB_022306 [Morphnus guianensis]